MALQPTHLSESSATQYELAVNGLSWTCFCLGGLHSAYVRGEALLAAHRYAEAAAEFQKILDHRGVVGLDPIGAPAHLQLGRAYALSGDEAKAKSAYQEFLKLWEDADPDIPILRQAKAEYARLMEMLKSDIDPLWPSSRHCARLLAVSTSTWENQFGVKLTYHAVVDICSAQWPRSPLTPS